MKLGKTDGAQVMKLGKKTYDGLLAANSPNGHPGIGAYLIVGAGVVEAVGVVVGLAGLRVLLSEACEVGFAAGMESQISTILGLAAGF
jgi:hypothetical protein